MSGFFIFFRPKEHDDASDDNVYSAVGQRRIRLCPTATEIRFRV